MQCALTRGVRILDIRSLSKAFKPFTRSYAHRTQDCYYRRAIDTNSQNHNRAANRRFIFRLRGSAPCPHTLSHPVQDDNLNPFGGSFYHPPLPKVCAPTFYIYGNRYPFSTASSSKKVSAILANLASGVRHVSNSFHNA